MLGNMRFRTELLIYAACQLSQINTINSFKKHLSSELESKAVKFKVSQL